MEEKKKKKEGHNLLGAPTFEKLDNGRFKCVETGHEVTVELKDSYSESKHCRLGLIDAALARGQPPLNMFKQDPASRLKLVCKLTGATINKTEEHIWKHINGRRFLNALEKMEAEKNVDNGTKMEGKQKKDGENSLKKKKNKRKEKSVDEVVNEVRDSTAQSSYEESENDFWMPPVGERWDCDDGGDRWCPGSELELQDDDGAQEDGGAEVAEDEARDLFNKAKRLSIEIGASSFASRKKKRKINGS